MHCRPPPSSASTEPGVAAAAAAGPPVEEDVHVHQLPPVEENGPGWVEESQSAAVAEEAQDVRMPLITTRCHLLVPYHARLHQADTV